MYTPRKRWQVVQKRLDKKMSFDENGDVCFIGHESQKSAMIYLSFCLKYGFDKVRIDSKKDLFRKYAMKYYTKEEEICGCYKKCPIHGLTIDILKYQVNDYKENYDSYDRSVIPSYINIWEGWNWAS